MITIADLYDLEHTLAKEYLEGFPGPVIDVSHDRYFLDRIAEQIFEVCPGGAVRRYTGNYGDYLKKRENSAPERQKTVQKTAPNQPKKQNKLRFSYMEQREYDRIDEEIADLEVKIAQKDEEIAGSGADFELLQRAMEEKNQLEAQLEAKMERWVYLNDLAEQIAAQDA